ncbi:MAG: hypothetical protein AB7O59_24355 [Pirellulales bacterium]
MAADAPQPPSTPAPSAPRPREPASLRSLTPGKVVETIGQLQRRIDERFPGSSLANIASELHTISKDAMVRADRIRRPNWLLRLVIALLIAVILAVLAEIAVSLRVTGDVFQIERFAQLVDSSLASLVLIGAAIAFLVSLEVRLKRQRALQAMRELRSLAHIVDMHQLTKDPERVMGRGRPTDSSPKRVYTHYELVRYLDYCSELLSLISKIGAIYVQDFADRVALEAVDQLSNLTNGLSRSIWQKIIIVENMRGPAAATDGGHDGPMSAQGTTALDMPGNAKTGQT